MRDFLGNRRPFRWYLLWLVVTCRAAWFVPSVLAQDRSDSSAQDPATLLAQPFESARQMLKLLNVSDSDWRSFHDGQDLIADDREAAIKILFRLPQVGNQDMARWSQPLTSWEPLQRDPASHRGECFALRGRARSVTRVDLSKPLVMLFGFDHYDMVEIECVAPAGTVLALTRKTPAVWAGQADLDEPVELSGMFLKMAAPRAQGNAYLFATPHIRWLPDRPNRSLKVEPDHVWLASRGFDNSVWETAAARNGLPLGGEERDGFYELLRIAGRVPEAEWTARAQNVSLARMLQAPEQIQGQVVRCTGKLRRVTRVLVPDPDIQQVYQIRSYYQLDVLLPVGEQAIEFRSPGSAEKSAGPVYRNMFPVTCCTLTIPDEWQAWVDASHVSELIEFDGIFWKLWSYPNSLVTSLDVDQRQFSPLLISGLPRRVSTGATSNPQGGMRIVLVLLGLLLVIWTGLSWLNRRDRKSRSRLGGALRSSESPPDFEHLQEVVSHGVKITRDP